MSPQPPPTDLPSRDPGVYTRPGAASVRVAALWDAIYELVIGGTVGITNAGAQALIDQSIDAHVAEPDPHAVYVTIPEGDARWGTSSGLSPHTHEAETSGGVIDYLRTAWGTQHLAAPDPHAQYQTAVEVQTAVDAAIASLKAEADPFPVYATDTDLAAHASASNPHPVYLTQAEGDGLYTPLAHTSAPDPHTQYLTQARGDARYYTEAEADARFQPLGSYLTQATGDARYLQLTGGAVSGVVTVQGRPVGLSAGAGNTLTWTAAGLFSDAPTKAQYDALVARVVALEGATANLDEHYHPMGTWRQTAAMVVPATQPAGVGA